MQRPYERRRRVALGAETQQPFNVAPFVILTACTALVVAVLKNERTLGKDH